MLNGLTDVPQISRHSSLKTFIAASGGGAFVTQTVHLFDEFEIGLLIRNEKLFDFRTYVKQSMLHRTGEYRRTHSNQYKKRLKALFVWSGCRESNPALMFPKHIYYRYTTPRYNFAILTHIFFFSMKRCVKLLIIWIYKI